MRTRVGNFTAQAKDAAADYSGNGAQSGEQKLGRAKTKVGDALEGVRGNVDGACAVAGKVVRVTLVAVAVAAFTTGAAWGVLAACKSFKGRRRAKKRALKRQTQRVARKISRLAA